MSSDVKSDVKRIPRIPGHSTPVARPTFPQSSLDFKYQNLAVSLFLSFRNFQAM